jgi:hypothetical protein
MNWQRGCAHELFPSRTLALQFLCESAFEGGVVSEDCPLGRAIESEYPRYYLSWWDPEANPDAPANSREAYEAWHETNIDRFISCVGVVDRYHCDQSKPWWDEGGDGIRDDPQATYLIAVTDPRWLAHLRPGIEWETQATIFHSGTFADVAGLLEAPPGTFPHGEWRS